MRPFRAFALALAATLPAAAENTDTGKPEGDGWKASDLAYVPCPKDVPFRCFDGAPIAVAGTSMALPTKGGNGVTVGPEEFAIGVDLNGDGKVDERLKSDGATASVALTYADGFTAPYMIRFARDRQRAWTYQRSGYWKGTAGGEAIALIDQDSNGMYDGYGVDAAAIGATAYAAPLSKVVVLGGVLQEFRVAPSGRRMWVREYKGEAGKIDAVTGYKTQGRLMAAVFKSGDYSFNVVMGKDKAFPVPAGSYELVGGEVGATAGAQRAIMRKGTMASVAVTAGQTASPKWGMDLKITFECTFEQGVLAIKGLDVHAYGAGGEEYLEASPISLTPDLSVWSGAAPKPVLQGNLGLCPQGTIDDFKASVGAAPIRIQLVEKKLAKIFGVFQSEVVEKK